MTSALNISSPRPIRSNREYDAAVAEIDRLLGEDPAAGTEAADRLELLALVVEAFDEKHHVLPPRFNPQSVVLFALEQHGKTRSDLVSILGSKSRVSEFLRGKRRLSLPQVVALRRELRIPADLLIAIDTNADAQSGVRVPRAVRVGELASPYGAGPVGIDELTLALQQVVQHLEQLTALLTTNAGQMDAAVTALRGAARESATSAWRLAR